MIENPKTSRLIGVLFLLAMITRLAGRGWVEVILKNPEWSLLFAQSRIALTLGLFLEVLYALTLVMLLSHLYPIMKRYRESTALFFMIIRVLEVISCLLAAFIPLLLLRMSKIYLTDDSLFPYLATTLMQNRELLYQWVAPVFLILGYTAFYGSLFKSRFLPSYFALWGFPALLLFALSMIVKGHFLLTLGLALPLAANEMFLGLCLIFQKFPKSHEEPLIAFSA